MGGEKGGQGGVNPSFESWRSILDSSLIRMGLYESSHFLGFTTTFAILRDDDC